MSEAPYQVHIEDLFEGPMDLLIHLVKKHELDIYDIPIALITDQYLKYLEWMKSLNIEFASSFVVMASTLTQIKSRMLLPIHDTAEEEEDPRQEITRPLLEYLKLKSAAEQLSERSILGEDTFIRSADPNELSSESEPEFIRIGLFELIDAFQKILQNVPSDDYIDFTADTISVKQRISQIVDILEIKGSVTFLELFDENPEKSQVIVTFLAILEMVKLSLIRVAQHLHSGVIRIFYQ